MSLHNQPGSKGMGTLVLLGSQQSAEPSRNKMPCEPKKMVAVPAGAIESPKT